VLENALDVVVELPHLLDRPYLQEFHGLVRRGCVTGGPVVDLAGPHRLGGSVGLHDVDRSREDDAPESLVYDADACCLTTF
jgi:hypothetical protein